VVTGAASGETAGGEAAGPGEDASVKGAPLLNVRPTTSST